ncbi:hypothetical protein phytr_350 [Candidatus Phycorickettsia trachydisci]|uniref:Glutamate--tRNA ligase n=1 Tax=Candidatus Phycorickettsia trachydisci TaxID=2115978 RepID=A0A2P1P6V9_9RICK|nr:glutamate--tRNA ligase [Candidatus Phycorickettsia trachydisci]AVP86998.1 hypothetical protein phytr_350 [Candidatus Phycorickettsia trachydisci]
MTNSMIITRFAPSPTGLLHVGSVRPALANYLFARKMGGKFILRIDDTDLSRCSDYNKQMILQNLKWLGLSWDEIMYQSNNLDKYKQVVDKLLKSGRLYECFEDKIELEIKRKSQLTAGMPPIYDRSSLKLSNDQKDQYKAEGKKPHYRFKLEHEDIAWNDLVRGDLLYKGENISDPIVIREDGTFTYLLCSVIDDIACKTSHIFRGEDHISNTAIQIQMFKALGAKLPEFGHLSLIKAKGDKISKRVGGYEVLALENKGIEPMVVNSFFAYLGTSKPISLKKNLQKLIEDFDISSFSLSPTFYNPEDLWTLNHKFLSYLDFADVKSGLDNIGLQEVKEEFWLAVRNNIAKLTDAKNWWTLCKSAPNIKDIKFDINFIEKALEALPRKDFDETTWSKWTSELSKLTGKKGKDLFLPLRLALTGLENGPEMKLLLPLIGKDQTLSRLKAVIAR